MTPRLTGLTAVATVDGANLTWKTTAGSFDGTHVNYRRKGLTAYATVVLPVKDRSYSILGMEAVPYEVKVELSLHGKVITGSSLTTFVTPVAKPKPPPVVTSIAFDVVGNLAEATVVPVGTVNVNVALCVAATGNEGTDSPWPKPTLAEAQKGIASIAGHEYVDMQALDLNGNPLGNWAGRQKVPFTVPVEPTPPVKPTPVTRTIGTKVEIARLKSDSVYEAFILKTFGSVTPAWEGKWASMVGNPTPMDELVAWAAANKLDCRLHNAFWTLPEEIPTLPATPEGVKQAMAERITNYVGRYKGKLQNPECDVFNEILNEDGTPKSWPLLAAFNGNLLELLRYGLKLARAADPSCKLRLNEYGVIEWPDEAKASAFFDICKTLASEGLLDGVGIQYHPSKEGGQPTEAQLAACVAMYNAAGLSVEFTEIALEYSSQQDWVDLFTGGANAQRFTFWGPTRADWDGGEASDAEPWEANYEPRTAIVALIDAWLGTTPTPPAPPVEPPAKHSTIIAVNDFAGWGPKTGQPLLAAGIKGCRDWWTGYKGVEAAIAAGATPSECCAIVSNTGEAEAALKAGVKFIEFQNEPYEPEQGPKTAEGYAAEFVAFANALAGKGAIILFAGYGSPWMEKALKAQPSLVELIGGITMHPYGEIGRSVYETSGLNGEGAMEAMYAYCVQAGVQHPELYITEWGEKLGGNPTAQAEATRKFWAYVLTSTKIEVALIAYYQTHDDGLAEWGLFDANDNPRPVFDVVAEFAKARD